MNRFKKLGHLQAYPIIGHYATLCNALQRVRTLGILQSVACLSYTVKGFATLCNAWTGNLHISGCGGVLSLSLFLLYYTHTPPLFFISTRSSVATLFKAKLYKGLECNALKNATRSHPLHPFKSMFIRD